MSDLTIENLVSPLERDKATIQELLSNGPLVNVFSEGLERVEFQIVDKTILFGRTENEVFVPFELEDWQKTEINRIFTEGALDYKIGNKVVE